VTTATISLPLSSSAFRLGRENSAEPKKTIRTSWMLAVPREWTAQGIGYPGRWLLSHLSLVAAPLCSRWTDRTVSRRALTRSNLTSVQEASSTPSMVIRRSAVRVFQRALTNAPHAGIRSSSEQHIRRCRGWQLFRLPVDSCGAASRGAAFLGPHRDRRFRC
jgi:hypothetical protein